MRRERQMPSLTTRVIHSLIGKVFRLQRKLPEQLPVFSPRFSILPAPEPFYGRDEQLDKLYDHFKHGFLVTGMTGKAGVGKTALARKLAYRLAKRFPDARIEIDLRGTARAGANALDPTDVMRRVLEPLFPINKLPENSQELHALYIDTLHKHKILLLLKDAKDTEQVRPLLPPDPSAVIVTSHSDTHINARKLGLGLFRTRRRLPHNGEYILAAQLMRARLEYDGKTGHRNAGTHRLALEEVEE